MPAGVAITMASQIFFSFFAMFLILDSFILKWWATTAADLNLRVHIKQFNFFFLSSHNFPLLLGSTSSFTSGILYGSHVVIQGLQYCPKHDGKCVGTARDLFLLEICNLLERQAACSFGDFSVTWHFKQILITLELIAIPTWGGYEIISSIICTIVDFIQLWFNTASFVYIYVHSSLSVAPCAVCKCCVHKFWWILTFYGRFVFYDSNW